MKDITIILPIHKLTDEYKKMFENAIDSIEPFHNDVKLLIVGPSDVVEDSFKDSNLGKKLEYSIVVNKGETDFCSQMNLGIENCNTKWFSILEIDDTYNKIWLKSMVEYIKTYKDVKVFLPIVKDINPEGKFVGFINESLWAYGFSEKQGFLDNETLLEFQNYQTSGGLYETETIKQYGKFKTNIKLTFAYEFLLRLTHNNIPVMTVPKIGYVHVNMREDSLFWRNKESDNPLTKEDVEFWVNKAQKEFFFIEQREINRD